MIWKDVYKTRNLSMRVECNSIFLTTSYMNIKIWLRTNIDKSRKNNKIFTRDCVRLSVIGDGGITMTLIVDLTHLACTCTYLQDIGSILTYEYDDLIKKRIWNCLLVQMTYAWGLFDSMDSKKSNICEGHMLMQSGTKASIALTSIVPQSTHFKSLRFSLVQFGTMFLNKTYTTEKF